MVGPQHLCAVYFFVWMTLWQMVCCLVTVVLWFGDVFRTLVMAVPVCCCGCGLQTRGAIQIVYFPFYFVCFRHEKQNRCIGDVGYIMGVPEKVYRGVEGVYGGCFANLQNQVE